jgi:SAM-dependent methyltransferase
MMRMDETGKRPAYADFMDMQGMASAAAERFAGQVLVTTAPDLPKHVSQLDVLDVGSGYGFQAAELAKVCRSVTGIEPMEDLHSVAITMQADNLRFWNSGVEELDEVEAFDLVVLDNVYEHLPDQRGAFRRIDRALRPGGVVYLLMPNRAWPREVHYGLPFLSWLPLPVANRYLRWSGRGAEYTDASYARTLFTIRRQLNEVGWDWELRLPGDPTATHLGAPWHYRIGMALLHRVPAMWVISKSFLIVAVKR